MNESDDEVEVEPPPRKRRRRPRATAEQQAVVREMVAGKAGVRASSLRPPSLRAGRRLALGASITIVGLALVGIRESDPGALAVLVGLSLLGYAIHSYGRLGPEEG